MFQVPLHLLGFELRVLLNPAPSWQPPTVHRALRRLLAEASIDHTHQPGGPALVAFPRVTSGRPGTERLSSSSSVSASPSATSSAHSAPQIMMRRRGRKALVVFHLGEALEELVILFMRSSRYRGRLRGGQGPTRIASP